MSRPDPKPTALALSDLLGFKLAWAERGRAAAELAAAEQAVQLAGQQLAQRTADLEQARAMIAKAYELGDGDTFNRINGAITRAPQLPTDPPRGGDVDQGDDEHDKAEPVNGKAKPNGKQESATNVA